MISDLNEAERGKGWNGKSLDVGVLRQRRSRSPSCFPRFRSAFSASWPPASRSDPPQQHSARQTCACAPGIETIVR